MTVARMANNNNKCLILSAVCMPLRYCSCYYCCYHRCCRCCGCCWFNNGCVLPLLHLQQMRECVWRNGTSLSSSKFMLFLANVFVVVVDCQQQCCLYFFRQQQSIHQQLKYHIRKITNRIWWQDNWGCSAVLCSSNMLPSLARLQNILKAIMFDLNRW